MKILFLNRYQEITARGAEIFVLELAKRLSKKYRVDIFSGKKADSIKEVLKGRYDIVIPINGRLQSLRISIARLISNYKMLITGHSGIGRDDIWNIAVCKPDVFVALTEAAANWARNWAWGSKVVKIPNGIDLDKFSPNGEKLKLDLPKPIILSVGALVWYKHHERVIRTVNRLGFGSVLIVGEGDDGKGLESEGKKLLGNNFKILSIPYTDMPKVYRAADLFTLPSWDREAFGIVYLEAMASGIGVVAPDDLSRREIVGNGGLFVNVEDNLKYAESLKKALTINWLKRSRTQAEKYSWDKIANIYEKLMTEMVKND